MQVSLKVLRGKSAGKEIPIPVTLFLIGRSDDCHLRPKSDAISRRHCELSIEADGVWARDLGSRNGTLVDGVKITERTRLKNGSQLRIGKLEFEVVVTQPVATKGGGFDVADWLTDDDESSAGRLADPDTRQFKLDETNQNQLRRAAKKVEEEAETKAAEQTIDDDQDDDQEESSNDDTTGFFLASEQKKEKKDKPPKPGKLPTRSGPSTDSSTSAAAETLKNFFNNRS